jgi:chromosome segregation protein
MRLNKIKLSGFKSFVDSTTIVFPSNLMGIVGPNGCGKSNVIDAIRWVLGESSAKTLRGDSMADVIFNGSGGRKPVGQASIELIFDNTDGTVSGAYASYSEIAIRRVITRDGTSQYFLNNSRCRRKDVTQLLLGTGLGAHGYSIIEQGMISRLVDARPEDLRAFLEEAAGISKYKERRRETEHRIRHTRDNLERLSDLREEIDKQLAHLQRQARAAERYKILKSEERRTTAELLSLRLKAMRGALEEKSSQLREKQLALEAAQTERGRVESEIEKSRVAHADAVEEFNTVQGDYYHVGAEIARLEQGIKHRRELRQRQTEDLETTIAQLDELQGHIESDEIELAELDKLLETLNPDVDAALRDRTAAEDALAAAERAMEEWRERRDAHSASRAELERNIHVENAKLEQLSAQRTRLHGELREMEAELAGLDIAGQETRHGEILRDEEKARQACDEGAQELETVTRQIAQLRQQENRIVERLDELRASLQNDRGRLTSLEALQEAALGKFTQQVDTWLAERNLGSSSRLAQLLQVETGWERAVEVVMGSALQGVQVDDIDSLAADLDRLGESSICLLESTMTGGEEQQEGRKRLSSLVRSPLSALGLLEGVFAAETLEEALLSRAGLRPGESVITRQGVWVGQGWLRVAGRDDPHAGVINRGEEIEGLRKLVGESTRRCDDIARALADTRLRIEQLEELRVTAQDEVNRRQQLLANAAAQLTSCRSDLEQTQLRQRQLEQRITDAANELSELDSRISNSRHITESSAGTVEDHKTVEQQLISEQQGLLAQLQKSREEAETCRANAQELIIKVESRKRSKDSASAALQRIRSQQQHLKKRRVELEESLSSGEQPLHDDEGALSERLQIHAEVETRLAECRRHVEAAEALVRDLELQRGSRQEAVDAAREATDALRIEMRELEVRADTVKEQFDATELNFDEVTSGLAEDATIDGWTEKLEGIGRRIQRLGAINLAAIGEFEEQSERKQYLDKQFADLSEALETLEGAIRKIDRETRAKFKDTFDKANQGLSELFPRLFGGGHAYLELDSEDLLEAGVSIMARPPGKRISTIHLLSGGEKALTAVALVFSIFELNPAPFCLLDEVDAPLDEANVGRFCDIVREMSKQVQFVLITHNKTTMEAMEQLSGVTMSEPGVSRLVAVDIDEAVQLAAM